jgi:hypothetical protein
MTRTLWYFKSHRYSIGASVTSLDWQLDRFRSRTRTSKTTWKWRVVPMYGYATPLWRHFHVVFDVRVLDLNLSITWIETCWKSLFCWKSKLKSSFSSFSIFTRYVKANSVSYLVCIVYIICLKVIYYSKCIGYSRTEILWVAVGHQLDWNSHRWLFNSRPFDEMFYLT